MAIRNIFQHRPRVAFVLGGGGNLGAVQAGQLKALLEQGVVPDVVIGCSVGALNGAAIAGDPTPAGAERLCGLWRGLVREDIFPSGRGGRGPWMYVKNGLGAFSHDGVRGLISSWLDYTRFEEAARPLWVVATSMLEGTERWFSSGDVTKPLLASTALPGVFAPVSIDGTPYIDGGVVNNVPLSKAFDLRAKRVYVLDVGSLERERRTPKRPYEVMMHAVSIARAHRFRTERDHAPDGVQVIRMPVVDVGKIRFDDFRRSPEFVEASYQASKEFLRAPAVQDVPA